MKKLLLLAGVASLFAANQAFAQETVVVSETITDLPCTTNYFATKSSNWFLEIGAGMDMPAVERNWKGTEKNNHITANYAVGFGKWFSPFFAWRLEVNGGSYHWPVEKGGMGGAKLVNANLDIMWDMFNSLGNVNSKRVFSIVPFVGLGSTYAFDLRKNQVKWDNVQAEWKGDMKMGRQFFFPVSAGLQLRFRLSNHVDFFAQGRASFYSDAFNYYVYGKPVDINLSAIGGFTFNLGGSSFNSFNPCDYAAYIANLNDQVNALRGELATTASALAAANAQLPCPEVIVPEPVVVETVAPLLATVRFTIGSARISNQEKVNVYNVAEWLKANPEQKLLVTGYADRNTGTSAYNMTLSERRAKNVANMLINEYGIDSDRIATAAEGSNVQPYAINNWNRIVVFTAAE